MTQQRLDVVLAEALVVVDQLVESLSQETLRHDVQTTGTGCTVTYQRVLIHITLAVRVV